MLSRIIKELIQWIRNCDMAEVHKNRIIEKIKWIEKEIKIYKNSK